MSTAEKLVQTYTYADYQNWSEDERWELINGIAYAMTAPLRIHQSVVFEVGGQIRDYLKAQHAECKAYVAPFAVRLPKANQSDDKTDTVVEPDIVVVCDKTKLDRRGCRGAPDWIIEVLSASTALKDMNLKRDLYEKQGVKEYWIVHPEERWVMVYTLNDQNSYGKPLVLSMTEASTVLSFNGLSIDWGFLAEFDEPVEQDSDSVML
ncbi:MAG: Uma2 family endonuclease [Thiofilum sp.]|uniref:Uma2 family endonuclease n=1 Tax=Thiofilum sp. TaxID=2212733 RepID=UPI0025DEA216|nr:Uma2 family endonuclease [Thiofilum sp.]MBK8453696.1 Uma2 family endonuclease [Thiofilum sp.]